MTNTRGLYNYKFALLNRGRRWTSRILIPPPHSFLRVKSLIPGLDVIQLWKFFRINMKSLLATLSGFEACALEHFLGYTWIWSTVSHTVLPSIWDWRVFSLVNFYLQDNQKDQLNTEQKKELESLKLGPEVEELAMHPTITGNLVF